jgi:hypothetical protein
VRRVVVALGTTQTLAWGSSSYYLPAMLADPIAVGLGQYARRYDRSRCGNGRSERRAVPTKPRPRRRPYRPQGARAITLS